MFRLTFFTLCVLSLYSTNCQEASQKPSSWQDYLDSFTSNFKNVTSSLAQSIGINATTVQDAQSKLQDNLKVLAENAGKIQHQLEAQNVTGNLLKMFENMQTQTNNTVQELKTGKFEDVFGKWVADASKTVQDVVEQGQQQATKMIGDAKLPSNGTALIEDSLKQMQDGLAQLKNKIGVN